MPLQTEMNKVLLEFPTWQLHKGRSNLAGLMVTASLSLSGLLDFFTGERFVGSTAVSLFLLPFLPLYLLFNQTSRIRFESDHVEKSTLLGNTRIALRDVKSYGVCIQYGRFVPKEVDPREVDEWPFFGQ